MKLCSRCPDASPADAGFSTCTPCRTAATQKRQQWELGRRVKGQCIQCPAPNEPGRQRCPRCLEQQRLRATSKTLPGRHHRCGECGQPGHNARTCPRGRV